MDYNLYPLWTFLAVAREGSLTRAGAHLGISQPAVSAHLKSLEQRFGERLLCRSSTGMRLTPFGEVILKQARAVFLEFHELERLAAGEALAGDLKIAASNTPGVHWLPAKLGSFRQKHPEIVPSYAIHHSATVTALVLDYSVPLGIVGDLPTSSHELYQEVIGHDSLQLMCAPSNALAGRRTVDGRQLRNQTLILREPGSSTRAQAETMLSKVIGEFERVLELNSNEALKEAVLAGFGVAVLSSWTVVREQSAGLLCAVAPSKWRQTRPIFLIRRSAHALRGAAGLLWDFLSLGRGPDRLKCDQRGFYDLDEAEAQG